jgi:hypothetical protein
VLRPDRTASERYEDLAWRHTTISTRGGATLRLNYKHDFN